MILSISYKCLIDDVPCYPRLFRKQLLQKHCNMTVWNPVPILLMSFKYTLRKVAKKSLPRLCSFSIFFSWPWLLSCYDKGCGYRDVITLKLLFHDVSVFYGFSYFNIFYLFLYLLHFEYYLYVILELVQKLAIINCTKW